MVVMVLEVSSELTIAVLVDRTLEGQSMRFLFSGIIVQLGGAHITATAVTRSGTGTGRGAGSK